MTREERPVLDRYLRAQTAVTAAYALKTKAEEAVALANAEQDQARLQVQSLVQDHPQQKRAWVLPSGRVFIAELLRGGFSSGQLRIEVLEAD